MLLKKLERVFSALLCLLVLTSMFSFPVYAADVPRPVSPREMTVLRMGQWGISMDGRLECKDDLKPDTQFNNEPIVLEINKAVVLSKIYVAIANTKEKLPEGLIVDFVGEDGVVHGGNGADIGSSGGAGTLDSSIEAGVSVASAERGIDLNRPVITTEIPLNTVLQPGNYTVNVYSNGNGYIINSKESLYFGPMLIKASDYEQWKKYQYQRYLYDEYLKAQKAIKNENEASKGSAPKGFVKFGQEIPVTNEKLPEKPADVEKKALDEPAPSGEIIFKLDKPSLLLDVQIEHRLAVPAGLIDLVCSEDGKRYSYRAFSMRVAGSENVIWRIQPSAKLPAGTYKIIDSRKDLWVLNKKTGQPSYYVETIPVPKNDITGTYQINVNIVGKKTSSFDIKVGVIDKKDKIEIAGIYKYNAKNDNSGNSIDIPFSQICPVIERTEDKVTASFALTVTVPHADYKETVTANAVLTFSTTANSVQNIFSGVGNATYVRPYTKKYGGDNNSYTVSGEGYRFMLRLPDEVQYAMQRDMRVGNVPGPENDSQAATGMIFPSLAALIFQILSTRKIKRIDLPPDDGDTPPDGGGDDSGGDDSGGDDSGGDDSGGDDSGGDDSGGDDSGGDDSGGDDSGGDDSGGDDFGGDDFGGDDFGGDDSAGDDFENGDIPLTNGEAPTTNGDIPPIDDSAKTNADPNNQDSTTVNDPATPEEVPLGSIANPVDGQDEVFVNLDNTYYFVKYDKESGKWFDKENGSEFDPTNFNENQEKLKADRENVATEQKKYSEFVEKTQNEGPSWLLSEVAEKGRVRNEATENLKRITKYDLTSNGGIGTNEIDVRVDKLYTALNDGTMTPEEVIGRTKSMSKYIEGRSTGRSSSDYGAAARATSTSGVAITFVHQNLKEAATGETWTGIGLRIGLDIASGGATEFVFTPYQAMLAIKEGTDNGESGLYATSKAIGTVLLGEGISKGLGKVGNTKITKDIAEGLATEYAKPITNKLSSLAKPTIEHLGLDKKAATVAEFMNRPISSFFGESAENGAKALGKPPRGVLPAVTLSDEAIEAARQEHNLYRASVKENVETLTKKVSNGECVDIDDVAKSLRDPGTMRQLKDAPEDVRKAFLKTENDEILNPTFKKVEDELSANIKGNPKVKVEIVRTPVKPGAKVDPYSMNTDVDAVAYMQNEKGQWVELPRGKVKGVYEKHFAETTGYTTDGKINLEKLKRDMPEVDWDNIKPENRLSKISEKHNQQVMDVFDKEAGKDFNPLYGKTEGVSNVSQVKAGSGTLGDAEALGKMEVEKVQKYFRKETKVLTEYENIVKTRNVNEGYEGLVKMGKITDELTGAYKDMGYNVKGLDANFKNAIEVISDRNMASVDKEIMLRKLNFNGAEDLASKLSGKIEGLKNAKLLPNGNDKNLGQVVALILKKAYSDDGEVK